MDGARHRSFSLWLFRLTLVGLAALSPGRAGAQSVPAGDTQPFVLNTQSRVLLSRIQSEWLEWLTAVNGGDEAGAEEAVTKILAYGSEVDMPRLPELSVGAAVRAVELARVEHPDRAAWALEAARRLDPGRPESAFAAAKVARLEGSSAGALLEELRGRTRTLLDPFMRAQLVAGLGAWVLGVLLLAALVFAAVQMATKGGWLYRDLLSVLGRYLPPIVAHPLIWVALLWPVLLPAWPIWLALYWMVVLWSYGRGVERTVCVAAFLLVILTPLALEEAKRRLAGLTQPGPLAVEAAAHGRLRGSLLGDLASLRARLPESLAVRHAVADVHRRLGQCDFARSLYVEVLRAEPDNAAALADLGVCSFESGDYASAIEHFQSVVDGGQANAAVFFNLSQAHSELYSFSESESALRAARRLDSAAVSVWMRRAEFSRMVPLDGGLARADEMRRELARAQRGASGLLAQIWRYSWALPILGAFALLGGAAHLVVRRAAKRPRPGSRRWLPGAGDLWRRVLLPGFAEGEAGNWGRAVAALVITVAVLTMPVMNRTGFPVPWGLDPGPELRWTLFGVALLLLLVGRFFRQRAEL